MVQSMLIEDRDFEIALALEMERQWERAELDAQEAWEARNEWEQKKELEEERDFEIALAEEEQRLLGLWLEGSNG